MPGFAIETTVGPPGSHRGIILHDPDNGTKLEINSRDGVIHSDLSTDKRELLSKCRDALERMDLDTQNAKYPLGVSYPDSVRPLENSQPTTREYDLLGFGTLYMVTRETITTDKNAKLLGNHEEAYLHKRERKDGAVLNLPYNQDLRAQRFSSTNRYEIEVNDIHDGKEARVCIRDWTHPGFELVADSRRGLNPEELGPADHALYARFSKDAKRFPLSSLQDIAKGEGPPNIHEIPGFGSVWIRNQEDGTQNAQIFLDSLRGGQYKGRFLYLKNIQNNQSQSVETPEPAPVRAPREAAPALTTNRREHSRS